MTSRFVIPLFVLTVLGVLGACAGSPAQVEEAPPPVPAPVESSFDRALKAELDRLRPQQEIPPESPNSALDDYRAATSREKEVLHELRSSYDSDGALPTELVAELQQVIDLKYDALWRICVEDVDQPLPEELLSMGGAL